MAAGSNSCGNPFAYGLCGWVPKMQQPASRLCYSVDDACAIAETGDLVLLSGHGFSTVLAELFSPSIWSHIGIVCKDGTGRAGLIEAVRHGDDVPTIGRLKKGQPTRLIGGVRVVDLRTKLERYRGYAVGIRHLRCKNEAELNYIRKILTDSCSNFLTRFHGNAYNGTWFDFVDARFRLRSSYEPSQYSLVCSDNSPLDRPFFCSELVAQIFMDARLLSLRNGRASQYLPDDFGENGGVKLQCPSHNITRPPDWGPVRFIAIPYAYRNLLDRLLTPTVTNDKSQPPPSTAPPLPVSQHSAPYGVSFSSSNRLQIYIPPDESQNMFL